MSRIKVMNKALSSRIAAGEVIERPASVVKELVENSLDAGAAFIEVEVERAGTKLICVSDNGCGMDAEDALLALEQHGTSKLLNEDDLNSIMTLGFRGEALPSIASVSKFTMTTRTADALEASRVFCDGGAQAELSPCSSTVGTRIEVRDLFYNLPARKKFLKSAATEEHHIEEVLSMLAIGHPETGFKLTIDRRVAFNSPGSGKLEYRLREIFGKSFVEKMLFFEHNENSVHVSGCIAAPGFTRPSRRDQRVFVNSRPVESQAVYRGIRDGYGTLGESGRYSPVVMFIDMPPDEVDVNVHPAKREVRFRSDYTISRIIAAAVSSALRQMRSPAAPAALPGTSELPLSGKIPLNVVLDAAEIRYQIPEKQQIELALPDQTAPEKTTFSVPETVLPQLPQEETPEKTVSPVCVVTADADAPAPAAPEVPERLIPVGVDEKDSMPFLKSRSSGRSAAFAGDWPSRIIGVLDNTFIICEGESGLILIDQHAAHERVMFERLLDEAARGQAVKQQLLIPETLELPRSLVPLLLKNHRIFEKLGFDVESAGSNTVLVNSLPLTLGGSCDIAGLFVDMLHELLENSGKKMPVNMEHVARAACKAAVKAHDNLSAGELETLLQSLRDCRQGTLCPHGRPTLVTITLKELEKRFGRR